MSYSTNMETWFRARLSTSREFIAVSIFSIFALLVFRQLGFYFALVWFLARILFPQQVGDFVMAYVEPLVAKIANIVFGGQEKSMHVPWICQPIQSCASLQKLAFPASANWTAAKCVPQTLAAMMSLSDVRFWGTNVDDINRVLANSAHAQHLAQMRESCPLLELETGLGCQATEQLMQKVLPNACLIANGAKVANNKPDYHTWHTSSRIAFDHCRQKFKNQARLDLVVALSWPTSAEGHVFGLILTNHGNRFKVYLVDPLDCKPVMGKFDWRPEGYDWARTVAILEICSLFK